MATLDERKDRIRETRDVRAARRVYDAAHPAGGARVIAVLLLAWVVLALCALALLSWEYAPALLAGWM